MKCFIVFSALAAVALARPGHLAGVHLGYAAPLAHAVPVAYAYGAPVGPDGRVVDTPAVSIAKAEHAAAHINEKVTLAHEAARSADYVVAHAAPVVSAYAAHAVVPHVVSGVAETPEVVAAKAAHFAAHAEANARLGYAHAAPAVVAW